MMLAAMTEAEEIIAEARELPLRDAAFLLWRECSRLDLLAWRAMPPELRAIFRPDRRREVRPTYDTSTTTPRTG